MTALGIFLLVIGAIITFAIDAQLDDVDLEAVGYILMAGGGVALLIGLFRMAATNNKSIRTERVASSDGNHVVEEHDIS